MYVGTALLGGLSGWAVAMWLAIRSWTFIFIALLLYLCNCVMLPDFPLYGCVSVVHASVSSGMTYLVPLFFALGL